MESNLFYICYNYINRNAAQLHPHLVLLIAMSMSLLLFALRVLPVVLSFIVKFHR